ncbi:MAG: Wzz/FepE/Etk N-terminal domain-containing protein [Pseudomonadota bacterium]
MNAIEKAAPEQALLPAEFMSQSIGLGQLAAILRAYLRIILVAGLVTMVLAVLVSKLVLSKTYVATATVLADYEVNSPDSSREFPANLAASYMATQVEFIGSTRVLAKVVEVLKLADDAKMTSGYSGPESGLRQYLIDKVVYPSLTVSNPKDSRLIYITYQADSAALAANAANAIAAAYLSEMRERVQGPAKARAAEYLKSVAELKAQLGRAETMVAEYRKKTGLIDIQAIGELDGQRLNEITGALLVAEADRRDANTRSEQVDRLSQGAGGDADVEYTASPGVAQIKQDLLVAERRLSEYSKVLGSQHPDYVAADAEVRALRAKLAAETEGFGSAVVANARSRSGQSSAMVESLKQRLAQEKKSLFITRQQQDEGGRLLRELEAAEKLYNIALDGYGQVIRSAESQYSNVSLLAEAVPPARHSKPKTTVNLVLGLLGGWIIAALCCLLWEFTHRRVRSTADLEQLLDMPVLTDFGARS